jgi:hypothetical protein
MEQGTIDTSEIQNTILITFQAHCYVRCPYDLGTCWDYYVRNNVLYVVKKRGEEAEKFFIGEVEIDEEPATIESMNQVDAGFQELVEEEWIEKDGIVQKKGL